MKYRVFYCQYETGKSVTSDDGLVLDLAVVCDQLLPELSPGDFLGVVDAGGTTVQTAVEKDHWWVEIPAPDEGGSYGKKLPGREAAVAFFRHLPEIFRVADFPELAFQSW